MGKRIITEADVVRAAEAGQTSITIPATQCLITPSADDKAEELGILFVDAHTDPGTLDSASGSGTGTTGTPSGQSFSGVPSPSLSADLLEQSHELTAHVGRILRARLPEELVNEQLEAVVREVIRARMDCSLPGDIACVTGGEAPGAIDGTTGVCRVDCAALLGQADAGFSVGSVLVADAVGPGSDAAVQAGLSGGYLRWENGSFPRTLEQPEIGIVIEGELRLSVGGTTLVGKPGDMFYLPGGVDALFSASARVTMVCVNNIR